MRLDLPGFYMAQSRAALLHGDRTRVVGSVKKGDVPGLFVFFLVVLFIVCNLEFCFDDATVTHYI